MKNDLNHLIILAGLFLLLFLVAEILYHKAKIQAEITRKVVHAGTGLLTLLFPVMLSTHWSVLVLCSGFFILLVVSMRFKLLQSINAIDRNSVGSIVYPIIVYICFLVWQKIERPEQGETSHYAFFYVPILIMALADPAAALTGKNWPRGIYTVKDEKKSLSGSTAFFVVALLISFCFFYKSYSFPLVTTLSYAAIIAAASAFTEARSRNGFDNITIPLCVLICMYILIFIL